jgi:hypothetical protein
MQMVLLPHMPLVVTWRSPVGIGVVDVVVVPGLGVVVVVVVGGLAVEVVLVLVLLVEGRADVVEVLVVVG